MEREGLGGFELLVIVTAGVALALVGAVWRWSLSSASYPAVWDRSGYPQRPVVAALVGDVVHSALERVLRALHAEGCDSRVGTAAVSVLRQLGGYSVLVRDAIEEQLRRLESNPRMAPRVESLRALLKQRVPEIRQRVQSLVTRMPLGPSGPRPEGEAGGRRGPLGPGSYPEIELRARQLRFFGRVDLLSVQSDQVTLTDYRTGQPDSHHADQLRLYALLWQHDEELNPALARRLHHCRSDELQVSAHRQTLGGEMQVAPLQTQDLAAAHPRARGHVQRRVQARVPGVGEELGELFTGPPPLRHDTVRSPARPGGVGDGVVDDEAAPARVIQRASQEDVDFEHSLW